MSQLVGVANGYYITLPKLDNAESYVDELSKVLSEKHGFEIAVLPSLERESLLEVIDDKLAENALAGGVLMLVWVGHGELGVDHTLRLLGHTAKKDVQVATGANLGEWAARSGARQVLLVIDTCHSGGGVLDAVRLSEAVDAGKLQPGTAWFGVLAASLADEPALSGALVRKLVHVLREGPKNSDFRWDKSRPFIRGDDLIQAVVADCSDLRQQPVPISSGRAWDFVRNPHFQAGIPDQPVEHLLQAARGTHGEHNFFTGREAPLSKIVDWMRAGKSGMFVLTGSPGCGKSAIAGRIASLSSLAERTRILARGDVAGSVDPGEGSVDAQMHARGLTLDMASEILAVQIGQEASGGQYAVLAEARRRRKTGDPMVFIIDGLDEARAYSHDIATALLAPLSQDALVLVATRNLTSATGSLIQDLGPGAHILDLDADAESTQRDVCEYVKRRLAGVSKRMDPGAVASQFRQNNSGITPFLLARLVTSQLREQPIDTSVSDWEMLLASSVESALERDLQRTILSIGGRPHPTAARELMHALALAYGAGFPADDVWPKVASAISPTSTVYSRDDVFALLDMMSRQLIASSEGSQPVYRIAHQWLVDYLNAGQRAPELREAVAKVIFELYTELLDAGFVPQTHTYLWRYAWRHFADGEAAGMDYLHRLVVRDRAAFLPNLAMALEHCSIEAINRGVVDEAVTLIEECVGIRRELNEPLLLALSLFRLAIIKITANDEEGADAASTEAIGLARESAESPVRRSVLAAALTAGALAQIRDGNSRAGRLLAEEAVAMKETLGAGDEDDSFDAAWVYYVAGMAASASCDLDAAARHFTQSIQFLESKPQDAKNIELRISVLASLAFEELQQALANAGQNNKWITAPSGELLIREYRENGPRHSPADVDLAKGLVAAVKGRLLDMIQGRSESDSQELPELVEAAIALTQPFTTGVKDAAAIKAAALDMRATLNSETAPEDAARDRAESERILRMLAGDSIPATLMLGEILSTRIPAEFQVALSQGLDCSSLLERQAEAVALLRRSQIASSKQLLANALFNLTVMAQLSGVSIQQQVFLRAETIAIWRELASSGPDAAFRLTALLADQAAQLVEFSPAEAADLARETIGHAASLGPTGEFPGAQAMMSLAASQRITGGDPTETQLLLNEAIDKLTPQPSSAPRDGALAMAKATLALLEMEAGELPQALIHASEGVKLIENSKMVPGNQVGYKFVYVILGSAQRLNGQIEAGNRIIHNALDDLRKDILAGRAGLNHLAKALNTAGANDLWEEALKALEHEPEVRRALSLMRVRPRAEIREAVHDLLATLLSAAGEEVHLIHSIARFQRSLATREFDEEWSQQAGEIPAWLILTTAQESRIIAWCNAPNLQSSRDYLLAHPELLRPETNVVIDEMELEGAATKKFALQRDILATASTKGIEAAYAPYLASADLEAWIDSKDAEQYLEEHPELMRPEIADLLGEKAQGGELFAEALAAILELAKRGERKLACQGLTEPDSLVLHFRPALESGDVKRLAALAAIVRGNTDSGTVRRHAAVMLAIARVLDGQSSDEPMQAALEGCAAEDREAFAVMVGEAIAKFPRSGTDLARLLH